MTFAAHFAIFLLLVGAVLSSTPQECNPPDAIHLLFTCALGGSYKYSETLRPCFLHGDFDGDGQQDVAIVVKEIKSSRIGIAILHSSVRRWFIIGAGKPLNGDDDFRWMDHWSLYKKGPVERATQAGSPPQLKGDAILAEKSESASGLIYWTGKKYDWYQQGD